MNPLHPEKVSPARVSSETGCRPSRRQMAGRLFYVLMLAFPASIVAPPVFAEDGVAQANLQKWQLRRLHLPTAQELAKEQGGNVYVYDGLTDRQVDEALTTHFDRIQNMMFVGTVKTDSSGQPVHDERGNVATESGGCL